MDRQLRKTIELKSILNVFDEATNDEIYKRHKNEVKKIKKKIDNHCPTIASSNFFPQMKLKAAQRRMEMRARANLNLVSYLNKVSRTKGKLESYNPNAAFRNSKLETRINEQKYIAEFNKRIYKILKSIEPSKDLTKKDLELDWKRRLLPDIIDKATLPIVIQSLLCTELDLELDDPPSYEVYSKSLKARLAFHLLHHGLIGKVVVMLDYSCDREIIEKFINICKSAEGTCVVSKVLKNILIEVGGENTSTSTCYSPVGHQYAGTLSLLLEDDDSIHRFCLTLKEFPIIDKRHIVIGRVIKGFDTLIALNNYGTAFGKPTKTIFLESCFLFK